LIGKYGPYDAFSFEKQWSLPRYLAIDQGPIPVMVENYRTGLLWELFMRNTDVQKGLDKLGFTYELPKASVAP
ncbi:MAG: beta-glucosidase, partial [Cellulophaga sp.]|nr:beta-glucosidase [Cellulophaga sp.]